MRRLPGERLRALGVDAAAGADAAACYTMRKTARGGESAWLSPSCNATHVHKAGSARDMCGFTVAVFFGDARAAPGDHFTTIDIDISGE